MRLNRPQVQNRTAKVSNETIEHGHIALQIAVDLCRASAGKISVTLAGPDERSSQGARRRNYHVQGRFLGSSSVSTTSPACIPSRSLLLVSIAPELARCRICSV